MAYKIVLPQILGRANSAAGLLSRMQTDPKQRLELQLLDSIPMKPEEIDIEAETLDASMLSIKSSSF